MNYSNKIYFNHIPKTAGSFFTGNVLRILNTFGIKHKPYIAGDIETIDEKEMMDADFILGHLGTYPNLYNSNLTTVTMLRNPIDRLISNYCMAYPEEGSDYLDKFDNWLFNDDIGYLTKNNLQSRFLTSKRIKDLRVKYPELNNVSEDKQKKMHKEIHENGFSIEESFVDYKNAKKYLDNCELIMISENISTDINKFFTLINNKWNIKVKGKTEPWGESLKSKTLRDSINKKQKDKIISLNEIDLQLYYYVKSLQK